uniref:hypothetical protein n=1 Tax=Serratia marcescens TaxID=615 RepID=UPI001F4C4983|nr:hypothetical protein [Serratia marcescens]
MRLVVFAALLFVMAAVFLLMFMAQGMQTENRTSIPALVFSIVSVIDGALTLLSYILSGRK